MFRGRGQGLGINSRAAGEKSGGMSMMDNNKEIFEEDINRKGSEKVTDEIVKITISKEAEQKLMEVMKKINIGFEYGKVNRQELASWIISKFCGDISEEVIRAIRTDHYDELLVLESILRRGKEEGKLPAEMQTMLKQQLGIGFSTKLKPKKILT